MGLFYMKKFDQYVRHLQVLCRAEQEDVTNEFIVSGIIDKFYIQFELGWKVLKELLRYEGANQAAMGSPRKLLRPRMPIFILWKKMYGWKCCVIEMMPHIFIMKKQHSNWSKKFCISILECLSRWNSRSVPGMKMRC